MSHGFDHVVPRRGLAALHPRRWKLWGERRAVVGYILTVDVVAVALLAGVITAIPVQSQDLFRFCLLVGGAVLHQEAVRQIEIQRERTVGSGLLPNLKSLWIFAAVLSVPLPLVFVITVVVYLHSWYRISRGRLYRKLFSGATMVLAPAAALAVLQLVAPDGYPIIPHGLPGLA
ncbi:MAG: hypothetical protein M3143_07745, partial [Actinomycetota bacterium]|nr:hypothetical protein [Actinomycetota bacterium]